MPPDSAENKAAPGDEDEGEEEQDAPEPESPTKDQLAEAADKLRALGSYNEGAELAASDLAINIYEPDPYYDDGYDAPFNQGAWDDDALPEGFPEMLSPVAQSSGGGLASSLSVGERGLDSSLSSAGAESAGAGGEVGLASLLQAKGPLGLEWVEVGAHDVMEGNEVSNAALAAALAGERKSFSQQDLDAFGVEAGELTIESFVRQAATLNPKP